jgi:DNA-binding winged helix-turn-helix (wHTH) protein/TolB-like protein
VNDSTIRFTDFTFDPATGELRRNGTTTRLEPQPARVLAVLAERAGEIVTRAELQQRVWSGDTFVDFEHGLNYCIAQIRAALGDSASEPRFIETLPRRGYRFIAGVERGRAEIGGPDKAARHTMPGDMLPAWGGRRWILAAGIGLIVGAAAGTWAFSRWQTTSQGREEPLRLAVVPFDNETGVAEYDRLAQTLTDATVARLAATPDRLAVVGNAAVLRKPRDFRDLVAIGSSLGVAHIVLGQVQEIGGQLRVTTHLIRVEGEAHIWAQRFEPAASETANLDRQVAEAVAQAVTKSLLGG